MPAGDQKSNGDRLSRTSKKSNQKHSLIQENLLGIKGSPSKDIGVISIHELREIRDNTIKGKNNDARMITHTELARIKNTMIIKSPDDLQKEKTLKES